MHFGLEKYPKISYNTFTKCYLALFCLLPSSDFDPDYPLYDEYKGLRDGCRIHFLPLQFKVSCGSNSRTLKISTFVSA